MNQTQRQFLIEHVEKTCDRQIRQLKQTLPTKPSLNNYLIAAFLDGSIQFADIEVLKVKMREMVLKMGSESKLVDSSSRFDDDDRVYVKVHPEDLFIIPKAYLDQLDDYEKKYKEVNDKIDQLEAMSETIKMKIQIGSSQEMEKIVMQVDNLADLKIVNSKLMLGHTE